MAKMNLGINWYQAEAKIDGENKRLPAGGYICKIIHAEDVPAKQYLKIQLEIAEGEYKNYFSLQKANFNLEKWPSSGIAYRSYRGESMSYFKGFMKTLMDSNNGFDFERAGFDTDSLNGKYIDVVFGEEEYLDQYNELKTSLKPRFFLSIARINRGEFETPKLKKLNYKNNEVDGKHSVGGYQEITDTVLPF